MAGLYYEQFEPGQVFEHSTKRTVTETDNIQFCSMTLNTAPIHIDYEYAATTPYGQPLVNSLYTLGLVIGISVHDTTEGTTLGNLGMSDVSFPKPVFYGDTLRVTTEVVSMRESKSRNDSGLVHFRHRGINQRGEVVCDVTRAALMVKGPDAAPAASA